MKDEAYGPAITSKEMKTILHKVFVWVSAATVFIVPLLVSKKFFFPFIVPRSGFFMVMVAIMAMLWAGLHYIDPKQYRLPLRNPLVWALGALLGVWIISGLLGADWTLSFWSTYQRMTGILMLTHLVAWVLLVGAVIRKPKDWNKILLAVVFSGALVSLYTIFGRHGLGVFTNLDMSRGGATIGNTSFLGGYVLFSFFISLVLLAKKSILKKWTQYALWISVAAMVFSPAIFNFKIFSGDISLGQAIIRPTLFLGEARAVAASIVLGMVFAAGLFMLQNKRRAVKLLGGLLSVGPAVGAAVSLFMLFQPGTVFYEAFGDMATRARYLIWGEALQAFRERPLFGWGPESFDLLHQRLFDPLLYAPGYGGELWFDRAHNIVIDTMVSTGLLGLVAYASVLGGLFWVVYQLRKAGKINALQSSLLGGLVFAYVLQNMTVFDMPVSYVVFFVVLSYAVGQLPRANMAIPNTRRIGQKALHVGVVLVAIVSIFGLSGRVLGASYAVSKSLRYDSGPAVRLENYEKAFAFPAGRTLWLRTVSTRMYQTLRDNQELVTPQSAPIIVQEADFFEQALVHEAEARPYNYRAYHGAAKMAQLKVFLGYEEKLADAIEYTQAAIAIAPQNAMGYLTLSELYMMAGDVDNARIALENMIALTPDSEFLQQAYAQGMQNLTNLVAEQSE